MKEKKFLEINNYLKSHYSELVNLKKIKLLSHDNINSTNYLLFSNKGKFVFRYFTDGSTPEKVEKLCKILNFCLKNKTRVMKPIKNIEGSYVDKKNKSYVTKYYEGRLFNGSVYQLKDAAKNLAILHETLRQNHIKYNYSLRQHYYQILNINELKKIQNMLIKKKHKTLLEKKILNNYDYLTECMLEHHQNDLSIKKLKFQTQLIHNDFHPDNLIFHKDKVAAIIDFNSMRKDAVAIDLAFGSFRFSSFGTDSIDKISKKMKIFIENYSRFFYIEEQQIKNFDYFLIHKFIEGLNYILRKKYLANSEFLAIDYERYMKFLKLAKKISQTSKNWLN